MPIKVLPEDIAIKIAAGEVVERPAAVIKELLDNGLDAGAKNIRVEVEAGGQKLIRVTDDGSGIPADQVETAFLRHATSKISSLPDLFEISTLGFRGEALPSIASVSRTSLLTRTADDPNGNEVVFEGGVLKRHGPRGTVRGTIITVEDLFYNVPARLKFLKSPATESGQIGALVSTYALAYPAVRFKLTIDNRVTFQSPGSGELLDAITAVYGNEIAKAMLPVGAMTTGEIPPYPPADAPSPAEDDLWSRGDNLLDEGSVRERRTKYGVAKPQLPPPTVWGYVSQPGTSRANRQYINFFVNHRPIESRSLIFAVTEAYHTLLMTGRFPVVVLNVELDPGTVDVNVHPAKIEVKFQDERQVFVTVQRAVRQALAEYSTVPGLKSGGEPTNSTPPQEQGEQGGLQFGPTYDSRPTPHNGGYFQPDNALPSRPPINPAAASNQPGLSEADYAALSPDEMFERMGSSSDGRQPVQPQLGRIEPESNVVPSRRTLPALRVIGQVSQTYIVAEGPDGMYMVDQHAAHERVMYERILADLTKEGGKRNDGAVQPLLTPLELELTPRQVAELRSRQKVLSDLGFVTEEQGERKMLVKSVPATFKQRHEGRLAGATTEVFDDLIAQSRIDLWRDTLAISLACHSAIRAGQSLSVEEMRELIGQLEQCQMPRACAHGRPTMLLLSQSQLEREFKRTGA